MSDRNRVTAFMVALILVLGAVLFWAAWRASDVEASPWLQQTAKSGDCAEGWSESWAEWANGPVCTREVDDPSCTYSPCAVAVAADPAPTLPPWPSGREFLYAGGRIVNGIIGSSSTGYTIVSSPFSICTTWSAARVTSLNNLVIVDSWVDNGYVRVYNPGSQTTISIYVTCA